MDTANVDDLITRINDSDEEVKRMAIEECSCLKGDKNILLNLINGLQDKRKGVQQAITDALIKIKGKDVIELTIPLLKDNDVTIRNIAFEILMSTGNDGLEILVEYLHDTDESFRKFIIDLLGVVGNTDVVPSLLPILNDPVSNIRAAALTSLGIIRDNVPLEDIIAKLNDEEEWVRFAAIDALSSLNNQESVPFLLDLLNTNNNLILCAIIEALGKIPNKMSVKPLISLMNTTNSLSLKGNILKSLIELFDHFESTIVTAEDLKILKPYLLDLLNDDDNEIRLYALKGLMFLDDYTEIKPIMNFINSVDTDDVNTISIIKKWLVKLGNTDSIVDSTNLIDNDHFFIVSEVLGDLGATEAIPILINKFDSLNSNGQIEIIKTTKKLPDIKWKDILLDCLDSIDGHIKREAVLALGQYHRDLLISERMINILKGDNYEDVKEAALKTLVGFGFDIAFSKLTNLIDDKCPVVRKLAIKGIGSLKNKAGLNYIVKLQNDPDSIVRRETINALYLIIGNASIDYLKNSVNDPDIQVRVSVVHILSLIKNEHAINLLIEMLEDEDKWVRFQVVEKLGKTGKDKAIDSLARLADSADILIKIAITKALKNVDHEKSRSILQKLAHSNNDEVKQAALSALNEDVQGHK